MVALGTGLGWEGKSDIIAVWFTQNSLNLVNGVGGILKLGNIETFLFLDVLADNLGDGDILGHTGLNWIWRGHGNLNIQRLSDKWDLEGLCLVFLMAELVFTSSIMVTITRRLASSDLHGFCLGLIGDLSGSCTQYLLLGDIVVGADLSGLNPGGLFANSPDLLITVVIVNHFLDIKGDWSGLAGKGWDTDLSIDTCVGVSAVDLRMVAVAGVCISSHQSWQEE